MITRSQIERARVELGRLSEADIEASTATTWAARAIAAYELAQEQRSAAWLARATVYDHEAVEHAASASADLVRMLDHLLSVHRTATLGVL